MAGALLVLLVCLALAAFNLLLAGQASCPRSSQACRRPHGTMLVRWRPDKAPAQCSEGRSLEELRPGWLVEQIL